jgi:hypothetical protein
VRSATQRLRETNRITSKQLARLQAEFAFPTLNDGDGIEVVSKNKERPKPSADELSNDISGNLFPWKAPKDGQAQSYLCNYFLSRR